MENPQPKPITLILSFLAIGIIFALYNWLHKPFTNDFARNIGEAFWAIGAMVTMTLAGAGIGRSWLRRWLPSWQGQLSRAEQLAYEALVGLGVLAVLVLIVGAFVLNIFSIVVILLAIFALTFSAIGQWLVDFYQWARSIHLETPTERFFFIFILGNLGMGLIMTLAPPFRFDGLVYHLNGPKLWVEEGQFISLPDSHFYGLPQLFQTLYATHMVLQLGSFYGSSIVHFAFGTLIVMAASGYATRHFKPFVGLFTASLLLATTSIWLLMTFPYIDLGVMAFGGAAMLVFDQWRANHDSRWLVLAAILVGFSMSVKYEAVIVGAVGGLYLVNYSWRDGFSTMVQRSLLYIGIASLVLAPWLIRTYIMYDNPVYPFGPPTGQWDELSNEFYFENNFNTERLSTVWWQFLFLPLTATLIGIDGAGLFDGTISPLFLMLIPLLWLLWRGLAQEEKTQLKSLLFIMGVSMIAWIILALASEWAAYTRRYLFMFVPLAIVAAYTLDRLQSLPEKPFNFAFVVRVIVVVVLIMTLINHVVGTRLDFTGDEAIRLTNTTTHDHFLATRSLQYITGVIDDDVFLERPLGWHIEAIKTINDLPDGSYILFLWETRSLYCEEATITCEEDAILMRWWHDRRAIGTGSASEIVNSWRARGVTHVLVWETGRDYSFDKDEKLTQDDENTWDNVPPLLEVLWQGEDIYTLYRIPADDEQ